MKNIFKFREKLSTKQMVTMSMFAALAYVMAALTRITVVYPFTYEMKDAVICLSTIILGAPSGIVIALLVSAIEVLTISDTGFWGFLMSFIASSVFSFTCSFIYNKLRSFNGAIIAVYSASIALTLAMIPLNIIFVPIFSPFVTTADVVNMIIPTILPFNLAKALINGAIVLIFYKPIITALRRPKLISKDSKKSVVETENGSKVIYDTDSFKFTPTTYLTIAIGFVTIVIGVLVFVWLMSRT
jgi:riboflavin transporter FmnP